MKQSDEDTRVRRPFGGFPMYRWLPDGPWETKDEMWFIYDREQLVTDGDPVEEAYADVGGNRRLRYSVVGPGTGGEGEKHGAYSSVRKAVDDLVLILLHGKEVEILR